MTTTETLEIRFAVKGSQQASTPVQSAKPHGDTTSTPKKQTPKGKTSGATAGVDMPGRVTIKNPDKIVFNRVGALLSPLPPRACSGAIQPP